MTLALNSYNSPQIEVGISVDKIITWQNGIVMSKILIVEDDFYLRRNLREILTTNGYAVFVASSVAEALSYVQREDEIDLYLLDVWLPDGEGFSICQEIRRKNTKPVIFLTVCDEEESVVKGLNMGGDDYVIKPYRTRELLSRIRANLRKREITSDEIFFKSGELVLDKKQGIVRKKQELLHLTPVEFALLLKLMENSEQIVKREQLLMGLWSEEEGAVEDNTLSVALSRLRRKIGSEYIETIRGFGYRFTGKVRKERYDL